jgi:hypothetical protein
MKIYIHHYYHQEIFYKLCHNTGNRKDLISNREGSIICTYRDIEIEFIFKQGISFETDGYHILDYFSSFLYGSGDPKIGRIERNDDYTEKETQKILRIFINLLKECPKDQKWIITIFRTEKILQTKDAGVNNKDWLEVESLINDLNSHHIVTDNLILNPNLNLEYPNFYYALTNTIFQWNENIAIRWFYEYKRIHDKLNFDYDLSYSIRNHKSNRVDIIKELSKLNSNRIHLQRSDSLKNIEYDKRSSLIQHISINSTSGKNDFENLECIENNHGYLDYLFRVLPISRMHILCESWSWCNKEFTSHYLSEKTIGFLLAGIPFISTHEYPLQMIEKILDVPRHPFYNESKRCKTNGKLFAEFVGDFLQNFEENYNLCKEWSNLVHSKLMYNMENQNSLLDLIIDGDLKKEFVIKKSLI